VGKIKNRKKILFPLINAIVFAILLVSTTRNIDSVPFHPDESSRIFSSDVYEALISLDFSSPVWEESYWTLTQPPVSRYIIGIGRHLGGYDNVVIAGGYNNFVTLQENIGNNVVPTGRFLWYCRLPMAILMTFSFMILFILITDSFGILPAFIFLLLTILNNYYYVTFRLAIGESPLLFFSVLALLFSYIGIKQWSGNEQIPLTIKRKKMLFWYLLLAIASGLAAGSKLNGSIIMFGSLIALFILGYKEIDKTNRYFLIIFLPVITGIISFATFVGINPYLYKQPLSRSLGMLLFRSHEMNIQQTTWPQNQIVGFWQHIQIDILNVFQRYSAFTFNGAWLINLFLFFIGIYFLVKHGFTDSLKKTFILSVFVIGFSISFPSLLSPLNYPRYFMFPTIFCQIIVSIGMSFLIIILSDFIKTKFVSKI
jgi:4-amino-4-deoxy-L-arabinose transferase-like glycosyltransferase